MSLREYERKRNFQKTPEPRGGKTRSTPGRQFVIQTHAASRLHYDLRLELDGTLKSWAVPKGPSLDPSIKSLAVQVEDHPLEYGGFEGVIPKGEYGGGTVMVWDHGTWVPEGDAAKAYKLGKLTFQIEGEKLHGGWTLIRMSGRAGGDGKNWLLMKQRDRDARPNGKTDILTRRPRSAISNRTIEQIAADADRVWSSKNTEAVGQNGHKPTRPSTRPDKSKRRKETTRAGRRSRGSATRRKTGLAKFAGSLTGARRAVQPKDFKPQLATLATKVPKGERWVHELKFDGYRILAFYDRGKLRLLTRQGNDWTDRFRSIADEFEELPITDGILDGEIVSLNEAGISDFQQLQNSLKRGNNAALVCYVFDVPHYERWDLKETPLVERKELLSRLILGNFPQNDGRLRYSDHIRGQGEKILQHACGGAMEGIVSKLADSGYRQARSSSWLKVKCLKRQEFVIGGFTKPSGTRIGFGALLLGYYHDGDLLYCGRVGTGFTQESLRQLKSELKTLAIDAPPFKNPPTGSDRRGVTWVKPELVGEVSFSERTDDGMLRHPSFQGLRDDKLPGQIVREEPRMLNGSHRAARNGKLRGKTPTSAQSRPQRRAAVGETTVAGVRITHPDRVVYADQNLTKFDLVRFYERISDWILPHIAGRPLTLVRCPAGPEGECFYQKHLAGSLPDAVRGVMIKEKTKREEYVVVDDVAGLVALVQMGVLEMHPWPAREDDLERPDRMVFDLDPGDGVAWKTVVRGAIDVREFLIELGLKSFLRTSGGKGLHVVVPLSRRNSWEEFKAFAKGVADALVDRAPEKYIATMSKAKRRGKVFIDYLRNQRGATSVASYSTRARRGAPVATPLAWDELTTRIKPDAYRVTNLPKRLDALRVDPWAELLTARQSLTKKMLASLAD